MHGTRHEEYASFDGGLPFRFNLDLKRSRLNYSKERNWHENLEIQFCQEGEGFALLNSEHYDFKKNDIVVVNSNVIHYTGTSSELCYSCLIVSTEFLERLGIDQNRICFKSLVKDETLVDLFAALKQTYTDRNDMYRTAKLNKLLIEILLELAQNHGAPKAPTEQNTKIEKVLKSAISYMRENYMQRITLHNVAKAVNYDKYALCREFKKYTSQTITDYLNNYRCQRATEFLSAGYSVASSADLCGFDNLSYFCRTFKKYIGKTPSEYKKIIPTAQNQTALL